MRLDAQATLRDWSRAGAARIALPPRRDWRASALWENHLFQEDLVLEAAWVIEHRGAMEDPWYLATAYDLPAITRQDAYLGFRLVGTHLGAAFLNLTDTRARLSAGALSPGRELRWRLHWTFRF